MLFAMLADPKQRLAVSGLAIADDLPPLSKHAPASILREPSVLPQEDSGGEGTPTIEVDGGSKVVRILQDVEVVNLAWHEGNSMSVALGTDQSLTLLANDGADTDITSTHTNKTAGATAAEHALKDYLWKTGLM